MQLCMQNCKTVYLPACSPTGEAHFSVSVTSCGVRAAVTVDDILDERDLASEHGHFKVAIGHSCKYVEHVRVGLGYGEMACTKCLG